MPRLQRLKTLSATGGYRPITSLGGVDATPDTIYRGVNFWVRPGGRLTPVKGTGSQLSAQNIGSRIYSLNQHRGEIAGGLVSGLLPKESLVRYQGSALFFVSENTSQQVYINESTSTPFTMTGVTTSSVAGKLRVALLSGTTYMVYDAGVQPPASIGTVTTEVGGSKSMDGIVSILACARRTITDSTSNPTPTTVKTMVAAGANRIRVVLPALGTGTDGWFYGGTTWGAGNFGPWRVIREVLSVIPGTSTFTNGVNTFTGSETRYLSYLRDGDKITVNATDYFFKSGTNTAGSLYSDAALTTPVNFAGATATYSITMKEIVLDWRNGELGELIEFDNDVPPLLDGIMLFNDTPFGWKGNTLYPSKIGNPDAYPAAFSRSTQSGSDIIQALAGDGRIYLLTTNGLEVVTFTQVEGDPYLIRQAWAFGFAQPGQAIVAEGTLYAAVGTANGVQIVRTRVDDSPDLNFSANIQSDMVGWVAARVVMGVDPANGAVVAFYNDTSNTTAIPWMLQQNAWSLPQMITGQVKDCATCANMLDLIIYDNTNFRAYQFEGGNGSTTAAFAAWAFLDMDGLRMIVKRLKATARADSLYIFIATPGVVAPDPTNTANAYAGPFALANVLEHDTFIDLNAPNAQSFSIRIDSLGANAVITEIDCFGLVNQIFR